MWRRGVAGRAVHHRRDSEVGQQRAPAVPEDVLGFQIAVHDAGRVGIRQRFGEVVQYPFDFGFGPGAEPVQAIAQGLAIDERHHVEQLVAGASAVEQRHDVGVHQSSGEADFAIEAILIGR